MERRPDSEIYRELADTTEQLRDVVLSSDPTSEALGKAWDTYARVITLREELCGKPNKCFVELRKKLDRKRYDPNLAELAEMEFRDRTVTPLPTRGGLLGRLRGKEQQRARVFCDEMLRFRKTS